MFKSLKLFFKNYINIKNRATRSEYWFMVLWLIIFSFLQQLIFFIVMSIYNNAYTMFPRESLKYIFLIMAAVMFLSIFILIAILIGLIILTIRRLHDVGKSGFWILLRLIPIIGGMVLLIFLVSPSEKSDNIYGQSILFENK